MILTKSNRYCISAGVIILVVLVAVILSLVFDTATNPDYFARSIAVLGFLLAAGKWLIDLFNGTERTKSFLVKSGFDLIVKVYNPTNQGIHVSVRLFVKTPADDKPKRINAYHKSKKDISTVCECMIPPKETEFFYVSTKDPSVLTDAYITVETPGNEILEVIPSNVVLPYFTSSIVLKPNEKAPVPQSGKT